MLALENSTKIFTAKYLPIININKAYIFLQINFYEINKWFTFFNLSSKVLNVELGDTIIIGIYLNLNAISQKHKSLYMSILIIPLFECTNGYLK